MFVLVYCFLYCCFMLYAVCCFKKLETFSNSNWPGHDIPNKICVNYLLRQNNVMCNAYSFRKLALLFKDSFMLKEVQHKLRIDKNVKNLKWKCTISKSNIGLWPRTHLDYSDKLQVIYWSTYWGFWAAGRLSKELRNNIISNYQKVIT